MTRIERDNEMFELTMEGNGGGDSLRAGTARATTEEESLGAGPAPATAEDRDGMIANIAAAARPRCKYEPMAERREIFEAGIELGKLQGLDFARKLVTVAHVAQLAGIKQSKAYRLSGFNNWANFCQQVLGINHEVVDEQISYFRKFGPELYESIRSLGLSRQVFRELKALPEAELARLAEGRCLTVEGETIPLDPEHADEANAAIESLLGKYRADAERAKALAEIKQKKLDEAELKLAAGRRERERLDRRIAELAGGELRDQACLLASEGYIRIAKEMDQLVALAGEIEDETVRRRLFVPMIMGFERMRIALRGTVELEFELPSDVQIVRE